MKSVSPTRKVLEVPSVIEFKVVGAALGLPGTVAGLLIGMTAPSKTVAASSRSTPQ